MLDALLRRVGLGDEAAFRVLYDLTSPQARLVALKTLRCPDQTDEVVQEVYAYVWQHAGAFDPARGSVHAGSRC